MDNQTLYLKTKPSKLFFKAAIPGGISMLASSIYIIFDTLFIGKLIGTTALAALGLAMPLIIINFALAELVAVGSSVPISILLGEGEDEEANNYFTSSLFLIIFTGLISGTAIYFASPFFMRLMGAEGELLTQAVDYARVYAIFSPINTLLFATDNYLRICGKIKTSMYLNIISSALTVVFELFLIIVIPMGIVGAALGSCIAMVLTVIATIVMFIPGKLQLKFVKPRFSRSMFVKIYKNGLAPFLTNISGRIFSILMNLLLMSYSTEQGEAVAIFGVCMTLASIIENILYGVVDALQPSLGYNYGARRIDRVKTIEKYTMIASFVISFVGGVVMFAFSKAVSVPFLEDMTLLSDTAVAVRITSLAYLTKWFGVAIRGFLMALEKPTPAMLVSVADACVIPIALIPILLPFKLVGLWLNYPIRIFIVGVISLVIILRMRKTLFIEPQND